jgi:hypothetical protein
VRPRTSQGVEVGHALVAGETMVGRDNNRVLGLPHDQLRALLKKYNRLVEQK